MPLSTILGGFETHQKHFFEIFGAKEQKEKIGNFGEKSEKRNFGGDILSISTDNRNFADISVEISKILFSGYGMEGVFRTLCT